MLASKGRPGVGVAFERGGASLVWGPALRAGVKGRGLTRDVDLIRSRSPNFQLQAPAALCVVHAAQRGHAAHTAPMHVHLAAWVEGGGNKTGVALQASPGTPDSIPTALSKGPQKRQGLAGAASADSQEHFMPWCTSPYRREPQWSQKVGLL